MLSKPVIVRTIVVAALVCALPIGLASVASAQGLTASIAPEVGAVRWGDGVGLQNTELFGGGVGLGFGRYVMLRSSFATAASIPTSLATSGYGGAGVEENRVGASLFSAAVQLRLGARRIAPVLIGTGGVLALSPEGRSRVQQVVVSFGGGVDARILPWLNGQLLAQDMRFRLDRSSIAGDGSGSGVAPDPDRGDLLRSLTFSASLGARLGGGRSSSRADALDADMGRALTGEGLMIPVELFAGVVRFSDGLGISDRPLAGLRAGLDFGPYFGLRGSYGRGVSNGLGSLAGMSTWAGEAQFNVGRVTRFSPHVVLGYGQMNFWGDFLDESGVLPDDQSTVIVGVGIGIPVTDRSRFLVTVRDYVTSTSTISGVATTANLQHNFGLSAGLSFRVRGRRASAPGPVPVTIPIAEAAEQPAPASSDIDVPVQAPVAAATLETAETVEPAAPVAETEDTAATPDSVIGGDSMYHSDRVVTLPIPTQGELYIRYGPPSQGPTPLTQAEQTPPVILLPQPQPQPVESIGATPADTSVVTQEIRSELATLQTLAAQAVSREDIQLLEERIIERMSASMAELAGAQDVDTLALSAAVQSELARAQPDTINTVTRADLEAMESRLTERLQGVLDRPAEGTPSPDSALVALVRTELERVPADSLALTRNDLAALETRILERLSAVDTVPAEPQQIPAPSPELESLSRQVDELSRLVRDGMMQRGAAGPTIPVVVAPASAEGDVILVVDAPEPFLRGGTLRAGTSTVRAGGTGIGVGLEASLKDMFDHRLHPFIGFQASRTPVSGNVGGTPYRGHVSSFGGAAGVSMDLVSFRSFFPALSVALVGLGGGTSGSNAAEAAVVDQLYRGFTMGPRVALEGMWRRSPSSRFQVVGSMARTWAGARGGWSFQVGLRWLRRGVSTEVRPFFLRGLRGSSGAPTTVPVQAPARATGALAQPDTTPVTTPDPEPQPDPELLDRVSTLERALEEERAARERSQIAADSLARDAQDARVRADSLAALTNEAARVEREQADVDAARERFAGELDALVGSLDDVQGVRRSERGLEVVLGGGMFPSGSTSLSGAARSRVERVARVIAGADDYSVLINGHTDATGSDEANLVISQRRAEAVRSVLLDVGVDPARLAVLASGEGSPLATNETAEGRAQNRRVEIVIGQR